MKISYKLISAFLLMILLLGFIGYTALRSITQAYDSFNMITEQSVPAFKFLNEMKTASGDVFSATAESMLYSLNESAIPKAKPHETGEIEASRKEFEKAFGDYSSLVDAHFPEDEGIKNDIRTKWGAFINSSGKVLEFKGRRIDYPPLFKTQQEFEGSRDALSDAISNALIKKQEERAKMNEAIKAVAGNSLGAILAVIWIFVIISAAGIATSYSTSRSVTRLRDYAEMIGKGNLNARTDIRTKDELGELASVLNRMAQDLKKSKKDTEDEAKELKAKLVELMQAKAAMLNMMEDAEELNKQLILAQKKLKENLNELKELDIKKDEFVSITSHELKTPLTAIKGFVQLMHSEDVINDRERREKYLAIVDKETNRLGKLISDILDLSKLDLNTVKFNFEEVDIKEFMDSLKYRFEPKAGEKRIRLKFVTGGGIKKISADMNRLMQVLSNLVSNAINYTARGSVTVAAEEEGESVHFSVADTGIGISKENIGRLFQRFYQVDSSMTREIGGSGLGLAICKGLVERMGGRIWIESTLGRGSTFHFTIPNKARPKAPKDLNP